MRRMASNRRNEEKCATEKHFSATYNCRWPVERTTIFGPMDRTNRFRHRIEYTKNKHSRAVFRNNTIIIRLAKNLGKAEEQEHIESLLKRMTKIAREERQKTFISPFQHLLDGGQSLSVSLAGGKRYRFQLQPGTTTNARPVRDGWIINIGPRTRRAALHKLLWSLIAKEELPRMERLVERINESTFRVPVNRVRLAFAAAQWGSCSSRGVIMLNVALLFMPQHLLKYVIIHELAHRIHQNHSSSYWREVQRMLPRYKQAVEELRMYRLPTL